MVRVVISATGDAKLARAAIARLNVADVCRSDTTGPSAAYALNAMTAPRTGTVFFVAHDEAYSGTDAYRHPIAIAAARPAISPDARYLDLSILCSRPGGGRHMIAAIERLAMALDLDAIRLDSVPSAVGFYRRMGFRSPRDLGATAAGAPAPPARRGGGMGLMSTTAPPPLSSEKRNAFLALKRKASGLMIKWLPRRQSPPPQSRFQASHFRTPPRVASASHSLDFRSDASLDFKSAGSYERSPSPQRAAERVRALRTQPLPPARSRSGVRAPKTRPGAAAFAGATLPPLRLRHRRRKQARPRRFSP